jgi:DNA-binding LacI/PurR family transcriptional regulator
LFEAVLKEARLPFSEARIWRLHDEVYEEEIAGSYQEQGYRAVQEVYGGQSLPEAPDGLVIINDLMTVGALAAFRESGLRLGEDVKIATHSNKNSNVLLGYEPLLSRLEIDPTAVVCALFDTLETLMKGETPPESPRWVNPVVVRPKPGKPLLRPCTPQPLQPR